MQELVNRIWYGKQTLWVRLSVILLLPLSGLFYLISAFRRLLYRIGVKTRERLPVPVIVVGNITVGGSGKTPTVIYLIELLRRQGYQPGVVSRGYGVEFKGCKFVEPQMSASDVGDEPAMIVARTGVPMVIGSRRVDAAKQLLAMHNVDVIISDDGLQHYPLHRDIEILVLDAERRLGNGMLMPAGPLREGEWRQASVDFILVNGQTDNQGEFEMRLTPGPWQSVSPIKTVPFHLDDDAVAMAGIGNPQRFFDTLAQMGIKTCAQHAFDDHKAYQFDDISAVAADATVLMTEKDAVKCRDFAKANWWYLPVDAKISPQFDQALLTLLTQHKDVQQGNSHGV